MTDNTQLMILLALSQVLGWDVERVKPLILGPVGTQLTVTFQRVGNQVHGKRGYDVTMTRFPVELEYVQPRVLPACPKRLSCAQGSAQRSDHDAGNLYSLYCLLCCWTAEEVRL